MDTLDLLANHEEEIADLYKLYAEIMPPYKDLWQRLADDEIANAVWIRDFAKGIEKGTLSINKNGVTPEAFQSYHVYLQGSAGAARSKGFNSMHAFTTSLYIEQFQLSLIESEFSKVLGADSEEFDKVVSHLRNSTRHHIEEIEKYWTKVKDNKIQ